MYLDPTQLTSERIERKTSYARLDLYSENNSPNWKKKYQTVVDLCRTKENLKGYSYGTYYGLALVGYYMRDIDMSFFNFKSLVANYAVKKRIELWFIKNLIASTLFHRKDYGRVRNMCNDLLPVLHSNQAIIKTLELNYSAQYAEKDFKASYMTCVKLLEFKPNDQRIIEAKKIIAKKIEE